MMNADHLMRKAMADKAAPAFVRATEPRLFSMITNGRVWKITRLEIFKVGVTAFHVLFLKSYHPVLPRTINIEKAVDVIDSCEGNATSP